ncbi:hypothetical protein ACFWSJ_26170 [Streptomyces niveus]|uniref:hypothetical protein n=1 Tax=Streptomyces niveus TaxID=193462 RepID=UPI00366590EB
MCRTAVESLSLTTQRRGNLGPGALAALAGEIDRYVQTGSPLPRLAEHHIRTRRSRGWSEQDPVLEVNLAPLARAALNTRAITAGVLEQVRPAIERAVSLVGVAGPYGREARLVPSADPDAGPVPWTGAPLSLGDVQTLRAIVVHACLLVTAAVSGMRSSELLELDAASCLPPTELPGGRTRFVLSGRLVKHRDERQRVTEQWIVIEEAYRAVELAAQLTGPSHSAFHTTVIGHAVRQFRPWVNSPAGQRLGLAPVPDGPVNGRMLRRTLALALAHRPGGVLATKIHLKHVSVVTTEGYARRPGGTQAAFLEEVRQAEEKHHLDLTRQAFRDYRAGKLPAGPGARDLIAAFENIDAVLKNLDPGIPVVLDSEQRLVNLLRGQARYLHVGTANLCWYRDPAKALCNKLAGTPGAPEPKGMLCDAGRCPQSTIHDANLSVWSDKAATMSEILKSLPRSQRAERLRLQDELDRTLTIINTVGERGGDAAAREPEKA